MWLRCSGYHPKYEPVLKPQELKPGEQVAPEEDEERIVTRADGKLGSSKQERIPVNTGIVRVFNIKYAVELT